MEMLETDFIVLCGGIGERLGLVDRPKPMALINEKPFLELILKHIRSFSNEKIILSTGFMGDFIENYYAENYEFGNIFFSREKRPLGTAGALRHAIKETEKQNLMVFNGDSFCKTNLLSFYNFYSSKGAVAAMVLAHSEENKDFGSVEIDENEMIAKFTEKNDLSSSGLVNAGIYIFDREIINLLPEDQNISLEYDFFPELLNKKFFGFISNSELIDIGTIERLKRAKKYFTENKN